MSDIYRVFKLVVLVLIAAALATLIFPESALSQAIRPTFVKILDSLGVDASDTTNHSVRVSVVSSSLAAATPKNLYTITNSAQTVVGSAKVLDSVACDNPNSTYIFLQFFDTTGAVTVGSTTPTYVLPYPPTNSADRFPNLNMNFTNGIKVAATTGAQNGTAPSSSLATCGFGYR